MLIWKLDMEDIFALTVNNHTQLNSFLTIKEWKIIIP